MILGERLSSIDILTATLLTRLTMIGEYGLLKDYAAIDAWFQNFKERPNFEKADMWLRFQPMRILLRK
jgi:glutathione S-transferase